MRESQPLLDAAVREFEKQKRHGEGALAQLEDDELHIRLNAQQNSIAVIMRHLAGNMLSRWTDFLATDGEKPTRNREGEFADTRLGRQRLMQEWEAGWRCLFGALEGLSDADLLKTVTIRNEPHTVMLAIVRQISHYGGHIGQILLLAKHITLARGRTWTYLTIAPGGSEQFNKRMGMT
jgi:hypothetical protein